MARKQNGTKGFLARLLGNQAGNVLAMTAAMLIPLMGLVGGGIDMSRLYLTKTRLQQACDAGALAGRRAMGGGSWTTTTGGTADRANAMFTANFKSGDYGATGISDPSNGIPSFPYFRESGGTVSGTAKANVPMMVVKVLGIASKNITVNCTAKMEIPNTDVMFVLDNTGSMADCPDGSTCNSNSSSKIAGLKSAVKCFYEALMKVNTTEVCGNDPTATSYTGTAQIRFGFVPYSVNVNLGKLLPNEYISSSWNYQSRITQATGTTSTSYGSWTYSSGSLSPSSQSNKNNCTASSATTVTGSPTNTTSTDSMGGTVTTTTTSRTTNGTEVICSRRSNGKYNITTNVYTNYVETKTDVTSPNYTYVYKQRTLDVSGLKAGGSNWNGSVNLPIGWMNATTSVTWDGCIEERQTVQNSDGDPSDEWSPIPSAAYDMDIDMVPSSTSGTKWGPILKNAVWARYDGSGDTTADVTTTSSLSRNFNYYCPAQAKKLQTWTTPSPFETYVNSLTPTGNTYHDIGMIWGARFISPTGIFASENATTPSGQAIQRHIVFMTDGDTNACHDDYSSHGVDWWDRRQTTYAPVDRSNSGGNCGDSDQARIINARLSGLCTAIKNKNITLWVISFGTGVTSAAQTRLQNCASTPNTPGVANTHFFNATDTSALMTAFQQIAAAISDLRLTS